MLKKISELTIFLFLILLLFFPNSMRNTFYNRANVRQSIQIIGQAIPYNEYVLREYVVVIENQGNLEARNMRVVLAVNSGSVLKIRIKSQEHYFLMNESAKSKTKEFIFDKFAPNSMAQIAVWTVSNQNDIDITPRIYTTFYGGAAQSYTSLTTVQQTQDIGMVLVHNPFLIWAAIRDKFTQSNALINLSTFAERYGIYNLYELNFEQYTHRFIFLMMISMFPLWIFVLRGRSSIIIVVVLLGALLWLFVNIAVNVNWIIILIGLAFFIRYLAKNDFVRILLILVSVPMIILYILSIKIADVTCLLHTADSIVEYLFCPPVSIPIGLVSVYCFLILYLLMAELRSMSPFKNNS